MPVPLQKTCLRYISISVASESLGLQERNSCMIALDADLFSEYYVHSKTNLSNVDKTATHL